MRQTPTQAGIFEGLAFAILYGPAMWFLEWREDTSPLAAVGWAALAGIFYGLFVAWLTRRRQRKGQS